MRWYEERQRGLGDAFFIEVERAAAVIESAPARWPTWPGTPDELGIRRFLLSRFPYALAYASGPRPVILAIAHLRRRPLYWLARKPLP